MTSTPTPAPRPHPSAVLLRIGLPFFLFSAVFALLLTASWAFLLPRYTRIEVGGTPRTVEELKGYAATLTAHIAQKEEERRMLILPIHDPAYDMLKEVRRDRIPIDDYRAKVEEHARQLAGRDDVIMLEEFAYNPAAKRIFLRGDVRNTGLGSMTTLADFALSLDKLPFVASHTIPSFIRTEDEGIGMHSPFEITLTLQ